VLAIQYRSNAASFSFSFTTRPTVHTMTPTTLLALGGKRGFYFEFEAKADGAFRRTHGEGPDRGRTTT
jgi:hypothetical protein